MIKNDITKESWTEVNKTFVLCKLSSQVDEKEVIQTNAKNDSFFAQNELNAKKGTFDLKFDL